MRWLLEVRNDLKPIGIDFAANIPKAPKGARSQASVQMEALPFKDDAFDAITSQFGIEYSKAGQAIREVGRTLRSGGQLRFLVHHSGGPLLRHNLKRLEGLEWAVGVSETLPRARRVVEVRAFANLPTPPFFTEKIQEARRIFGAGSGAEEIIVAIYQTIELSRGASVNDAKASLDELESAATGEIRRVRALARAAMDADKVRQCVGQIELSGIAVVSVEEISEGQGREPFAWLLDGLKS